MSVLPTFLTLEIKAEVHPDTPESDLVQLRCVCGGVFLRCSPLPDFKKQENELIKIPESRMYRISVHSELTLSSQHTRILTQNSVP